MNALRDLWGAWNTSTPDLDTNLAGWNPEKLVMESDTWAARYTPCATWRGVQCVININCTNAFNTTQEYYCDIYITGL